MATPRDAAGFGVVSRRRVLGWSLGAGGVLLMGGGLGLWRLRGTAPPVPGLRTLSDHEYRTMKALAGTIVPPGGPFPQGADDFDLARAFDVYLADEPEQNVRDLKRALFLVEYGPVLFERRLATFSNLDPAARRAHWDGWEASQSATRRQVAFAFRKFVTFVFFAQPAVGPLLGYEGVASEAAP